MADIDDILALYSRPEPVQNRENTPFADKSLGNTLLSYDTMDRVRQSQGGPEAWNEAIKRIPRGPELRNYEPTLRDKIGALIAGDNSSSGRRSLAHMLAGTSGLGYDRTEGPFSLADATGVGQYLDSLDHIERREPWNVATDALSAALNLAGARGLGKAPQAIADSMKGERWFRHAPEDFRVVFGEGTPNAGAVSGYVNGNNAHIGRAFQFNRASSSLGDANTVGTADMRRVFDALRNEYPGVTNVTAHRISGARHHDAYRKPPEAYVPRDARSQMEITVPFGGSRRTEGLPTVERMRGTTEEQPMWEAAYDVLKSFIHR